MKLQFININYNNITKNDIYLNNNLFKQAIAYNNIKANELKDKQTDEQQKIENLEQSKIRWGPSTWYLFHTLAQKIKNEDFFNIKNELLDIIKSICINLPCPSCAQHASNYMKNVNYNSIKSKEDLKIFFYNFHNFANQKNNKPLFNISELEEKYTKANTINIIKNFIKVFQYKSKSFNMIANEMQRQREIEVYKKWFNNNIQSFEL
jgi:ABC-type antimicrobial peptide transport system permease subunit